MVDVITRVVIGKAQRETRFQGRSARVDSTVVEADVRYPSDAMLALQGARALAREARKLRALVRTPAVRVRDRSRAKDSITGPAVNTCTSLRERMDG